MAPSYSFPILDPKEICKVLSDLGSPRLSLDLLSSPSADVLAPVYDFLVSLSFPSSSRDDSIQPSFAALQQLGDYPELYTDAIGIITSFRRLKKFMASVGADDFTLFDLHRPQPQRTVRFLSAAINFATYSANKMVYITELKEARNRKMAEVEELQETLSQRQGEIQGLQQERLAKQPQVQALEQEVKELSIQIVALNKQQSGLQSDINALKQESNTYGDKIGNLDFVLMQKQQEQAQLRSQIVENPEELQRILEEKKSALKEAKELSRDAFESCKRWKTRVQVLAKAERKLAKHRKMLQSLEDQVNARKTAERVLKERKAKLKAMEKEERSKDANRVEMNLEADRLVALIKTVDQKISANARELEDLTTRNARSISEHAAIHQNVAEMQNQIEALNKKNKDLLTFKEDMVAKFKYCKEETMRKGIEYVQSIMAKAGIAD